MLTDLLLTAFGLFLLVGGGDLMVRGASALAKQLNVSPVAIGLTVVAFGTSAPELAVNVVAAWRDATELSFGNIFGSNMANIGLIVALTALMQPLTIHRSIIRREVPMMLLATLVATCLALDVWLDDGTVNHFGRSDGLVLLLLFSVFVYYTVGDLVSQREEEGAVEPEDDGIPDTPTGISVFQTVAGIVGLVAGGSIAVTGATGVATAMGVSQAIIGLTLLAVGTSLPELTASLMATVRGHSDLAVGNVVGSNIFNLLIVLGVTSVIRPVEVPTGGIGDLAMVIALSVLLWFMSVNQANKIIRTEAAVLLVAYVAYIGWRAI